MILQNSFKKTKKTYNLKNKNMNSEVFLERKKVLNCIYELKKIVPNLPRIEVKITHDGVGDDFLIKGLGRLNKKMIWITNDCLKQPYLYQVVAHEILHAVLGIEHNEECPLMKAKISQLSKNKVNLIFKSYFRNS